MKVYLIKTIAGLIPANSEAEKWLRKKKLGSVISAEVKQVRNYAFHKKLFALFNLGYDYWQPGTVSSKHGTPEKNFDRFRKDLTILAGHYHSVVRLDGTVRIEADSLSFGSMSQETFNNLYKNVLDVIMKRIPVLNNMTEDEINELIEKVLSFT